MQDHDRGSYRDARRRQAKEAAEAIKRGEGEDMFFGASPSERKDLRETKDKRTVDLGQLDLSPLDRGKFNAPEKVGENLRLIDMAMGNEPAAPKQPGLHPAAPKKQAQPRTKKQKKQKKKRRPRSSARNLIDSAVSKVPSWFRRQAAAPERDDFKPAPAGSDEGVVVAKPRGRGLERLLWLGALGCLGAGAAGVVPAFVFPSAAVAFPDGLQALLTSQHGLLGLGVICAWLAVDLRVVRRPRGSVAGEVFRSAILAAIPTAFAAAVVYAAGLTPNPGLAPAGLLPALEPLKPHLAGLGLPLAAGVGAAGFALAFALALVVRLRAPKL